MKKRTLYFLIFCWLAAEICFAAPEQEVRVKAEVDKAFLTIGDPVTYTVTVEHPQDVQVLSTVPAPDSAVLEIKKIEDIKRTLKKKAVTGRKFVLTTYRLGEFVLDPVTIQYRRGSGPVESVQTNKLYLTVKSVAAGDPKEDIRDVKSVVPFKFRIGKWLWALIILTSLALTYAVFCFFLKKKALLPPAAPPLSAEEEALLRLAELFESDLLKRGLFKLYYLRLSEILRLYFERRYKILAVESTTIEILRALKAESLDTELYKKVQYVLEAADLAKFAKWVPAAADVQQINRKSEEIVKESAPVPEPAATAEAPHGV